MYRVSKHFQIDIVLSCVLYSKVKRAFCAFETINIEMSIVTIHVYLLRTFFTQVIINSSFVPKTCVFPSQSKCCSIVDGGMSKALFL